MDNNYQVTQKKTSGVAIAAFVCGLVSFLCCNPFYLVSLAAVILGIIGLCTAAEPKWMTITGLILGAVAIPICICIDILTAGKQHADRSFYRLQDLPVPAGR